METDPTLVRRRAEFLFEEITRAYDDPLEFDWPPFRQCAMAWYVAGILYENYDRPPISDVAYDGLSRYLLDHLKEAHAAGADLLVEADLRAGTAMGWRDFPKPFHDVADVMAQPLKGAK
ncbi:MAG: hypothetical protein V3S94_05670 [Gammaproteobacteria bacterium]